MAVTLEVKDKVLHLVEGDKRYTVGADGVKAVVEQGMPEVKIEGAKATGLLDNALKEIEAKGSALSKEVKDALTSSIDHFQGAGAKNRLGRIKAAIEKAAQIEHVADAQAAEAILKSNPLAEAFLTEAGYKKLDAVGFKMPEFKEGLKAAAEKAATVTKLKTDLTALASAEKPSVTAINTFLKANQAHLPELKIDSEVLAKLKVNADGYDFEAVRTGMLSKIEAQAEEAKTLITKLIQERNIINLNDDEKAVEAAKKAAGELEKQIATIRDGEFGAGVKAKLPKELVSELGEVHPEFGSKLGVATNGAAKGSWFTKAESELSDVTPEKLKGLRGALWYKRTTAGKAGIIAGATAVTYALVSAIGGKGPGERAEAVSKSRDGQSTGVGVA